MASFSQARINAGIDGRIAGNLFLSAHTAFSTTGASEVSGGSPTYRRQSLTMGATVAGISTNTSSESLAIPPSTTVQYVGIFDAAVGGAFYGMFPLGSSSTHVGSCLAASEASAVRDTFFVANHGFSAAATVAFFAVSDNIPGGIVEGTIYHITGVPTSNTFQVAATAGGGAVTITATSPIIVTNIVAETFANQGTLELAAGALDIVGLA